MLHYLITCAPQFFALKRPYHWQLICYFRIGTSKGCKWIQSHAHKMRFWYLLGVFSKISNEHPHNFHRGAPLGFEYLITNIFVTISNILSKTSFEVPLNSTESLEKQFYKMADHEIVPIACKLWNSFSQALIRNFVGIITGNYLHL